MLIEISVCAYDGRVITSLKYSPYFVKPVIVNGKPAYKGQVPYMVSIKEATSKLDEDRILWTNLCGGSIISEAKILTAAHCFEGNNFFLLNNPRFLRLVAGSMRNDIVHSRETETTEHSQWRMIHYVVVHSEFLFPTHDIALVFVKSDFKFTSSVNSIPPATIRTDYSDSCYSAGFGTKAHVSRSDLNTPVMLIARIHTMTQWKCSTLWGMDMHTFICTDSKVSDVAFGDSGGPLACSEASDPVGRGGDVLAGIVSGKNFDMTTLYTRVSSYRDWIERDSGSAVELKTCLLLIILINLIYLLFCLHFCVLPFLYLDLLYSS